jgi:hypothetical protein
MVVLDGLFHTIPDRGHKHYPKNGISILGFVPVEPGRLDCAGIKALLIETIIGPYDVRTTRKNVGVYM